MAEYHAGQRVRIEWPDGSAVEGTLVAPRDYSDPSLGPVVYVPSMSGYTAPEIGGDGRTVTVLSEPPRPEEPTGPWAVVEAAAPWRTARAAFVREPGGLWVHFLIPNERFRPPKWQRDKVTEWANWSDLIDPVVLSEGWTP